MNNILFRAGLLFLIMCFLPLVSAFSLDCPPSCDVGSCECNIKGNCLFGVLNILNVENKPVEAGGVWSLFVGVSDNSPYRYKFNTVEKGKVGVSAWCAWGSDSDKSDYKVVVIEGEAPQRATCPHSSCEGPNPVGCKCGDTETNRYQLYCCAEDNAVFYNSKECKSSPHCGGGGRQPHGNVCEDCCKPGTTSCHIHCDDSFNNLDLDNIEVMSCKYESNFYNVKFKRGGTQMQRGSTCMNARCGEENEEECQYKKCEQENTEDCLCGNAYLNASTDYVYCCADKSSTYKTKSGCEEECGGGGRQPHGNVCEDCCKPGTTSCHIHCDDSTRNIDIDDFDITSCEYNTNNNILTVKYQKGPSNMHSKTVTCVNARCGEENEEEEECSVEIKTEREVQCEDAEADLILKFKKNGVLTNPSDFAVNITKPDGTNVTLKKDDFDKERTGIYKLSGRTWSPKGNRKIKVNAKIGDCEATDYKELEVLSSEDRRCKGNIENCQYKKCEQENTEDCLCGNAYLNASTDYVYCCADKSSTYKTKSGCKEECKGENGGGEGGNKGLCYRQSDCPKGYECLDFRCVKEGENNLKGACHRPASSLDTKEECEAAGCDWLTNTKGCASAVTCGYEFHDYSCSIFGYPHTIKFSYAQDACKNCDCSWCCCPGHSKTSGKPDLTITDIQIYRHNEETENVVSGTSYSLVVIIKNVGDKAAHLDSSSEGLTFYINGKKYAYHTYSQIPTISPGETLTYIFEKRWKPGNPGEYTLKAKIDTNNLIDESNENNNVRTETLTVASSTQSCIDTEPSDEEEVVFSTKGTCTDLTGSYEDTCTEDGKLLEYQCCSGVSSRYCVGMEIDCKRYGFDRCENGACVKITSTSKPDLVVSDISWTPANPKVGDKVVFKAKVKNIGTADVDFEAIPEEAMTLYIDGTRITGLGYGDLDWYYPTDIAAGHSQVYTFVDDKWTPREAKTYTVKVKIDSDNLIDESNENNNVKTETLTVSSSPTSKPDLVVTDIYWTPRDLSSEYKDWVYIYAKIKNIGYATANNFRAYIDVNGRVIYKEAISLGAGKETNRFMIGYKIGPNEGLHVGENTIKVKVDCYNTVDESNENNNVRTETLTVASSTSSSCSDTDDTSIVEKGVCTDSYGEHVDRCDDYFTLIDYHCSSAGGTEPRCNGVYVVCKDFGYSRCSNGVCVK